MSKIVELPPTTGLRPDGAMPGGWWHETDEPGRVICDLCPRACALRPGDRGFCFVRENRAGEMVLSTYGRSTGFCIDPIEKKPLNHFYPGTSVLSFGTAGCNLGCKFCQNWSISKSREIELLSEAATPEAVAEAARQLGCRSVAFTYNDPVIWAEYAIDTARACRAVGVKAVAVTAGYITPAARGPFYAVMDAANVDLKGFTEGFYQHLTLSHLEPVLDTLRWLKHETDVWFEITNLLIPRANDSLDEIRQMCDWVLANVGPDVPVHFTAFHPDFRLTDRGPTPPETLLAAHEIARAQGLHYVYVGNIHAPRQQSTYCPQCGQLLIERDWYELPRYAMRLDCCPHCGTRIAGHFDRSPGNWGQKRVPVRIASYAAPPAAEPNQGTMMSTQQAPTSGRTGPAVCDPPELNAEKRQAILRAAGNWLAAAAGARVAPLTDATLAGVAQTPVMGVFVSLKRAGRLRSCCGFLGPSVPLSEALAHAAGRAANDDPRFPPLSLCELAHVDLEVWLLHGSRPVAERGDERVKAVAIGKHGVQIVKGESRGLLLPSVAVEQSLDAEAFLRHVALKAGLPASTWKDDDATVSTFEAVVLAGSLADVLPAALTDGTGSQVAGPNFPSPLSPADVAALAEFCRSNILAVAAGATPNCYALGVADANVSGLAVVLTSSEGDPWLQASRHALRQAMPLQATLFGLAEGMGQSLRGAGVEPALVSAAQVDLLVLFDPAAHGAVQGADLAGFDPARRALLVVEGGKSAITFAPGLQPESILRKTSKAAQVLVPETAAVFSLAAVCTAQRLATSHAPRPQAGPAVRSAAVAGTFYPADPAALAALVDGLLAGEPVESEVWPAVMVPHAGLVYSGRIAADTFKRVKIPETVIVIGPKHTPHGVDWSVAPHHTWSLPGGTLAADPELARQLTLAIPGLQFDAAAHQHEHAIEVELPFIARLAPRTKVLGIVIGAGNLQRARQFAEGLARVLMGRPDRPLLVISSDMNHFADDEENRRLDAIALAAMERLDPAALYDTVTRRQISMCGLLPAVIVMETLQRLGTLSRVQRVGYATSADAGGDRGRVVGYAGMLLG
ncbi:MAG TPA: AmmeMemoRadiSam system radical SAM enzyme [Pirellulales bacterium]|nr:AmmeMemoRadiSam system radical SAM enzyme [Pirellulales bacterium]